MDFATAPTDGSKILLLLCDDKRRIVVYESSYGWITVPGAYSIDSLPRMWMPLPLILAAAGPILDANESVNA
jgi:hypothetical protein